MGICIYAPSIALESGNHIYQINIPNAVSKNCECENAHHLDGFVHLSPGFCKVGQIRQRFRKQAVMLPSAVVLRFRVGWRVLLRRYSMEARLLSEAPIALELMGCGVRLRGYC